MSNNNDQVILSLKKQIEEKKAQLNASKKFSPITHCSIDFDGIRANIHAINKEQAIALLVKLNVYKMSAKELDLLDEYLICGYSIDNWIDDVKAKLVNLNRKIEEDRLKAMEARLHNLLSNEKKVELEIEEIASSLKQ